MAQEEPNRFVEWYLLVRRQIPVARVYLNTWLGAVREEPSLIWQTLAVRYAVYGTGGLVLMLLFLNIPSCFSTDAPASVKPLATKADFHVVCFDPDCEYHFVINRDFGFRKFPVRCPKCEQETGARASRCASEACRGRWVAPQELDERMHCPRCGEPMD